jgi:hypothetical protein
MARHEVFQPQAKEYRGGLVPSELVFILLYRPIDYIG